MHRYDGYIMRDQVRDRVRAIMGEGPGRAGRRTGRTRSRQAWLSLLALAASTALLSLARGTFG